MVRRLDSVVGQITRVPPRLRARCVNGHNIQTDGTETAPVERGQRTVGRALVEGDFPQWTLKCTCKNYVIFQATHLSLSQFPKGLLI